jgi:hypothetical protein
MTEPFTRPVYSDSQIAVVDLFDRLSVVFPTPVDPLLGYD